MLPTVHGSERFNRCVGLHAEDRLICYTVPMDPSALLRGRSRETRIRRDARGRWFDGEVPISHPKLVDAFGRWIEVAPDGRYCLRNDVNWAYVAIEGAPLEVLSVSLAGGEALLHLSDGREEQLEARTLRQGPEGALYCDARGGAMTARFSRHAAQQLAAVMGEDGGGVYLELGGERVRPPTVDAPVRPPRPTI